MRPANWQGFITVKNLETGESRRVQNAILDGGFTLTGQLWLGQTTEEFAQLQIEDATASNTLAKAITGSYDVTSGVLTVTSTALFTSGEVSFDVATVALLGSTGTRIAEASVSITAGTAVEITREDQLSAAV